MAQTNYVYNQVLSGTVDGVNTVFTCPQPIDVIEDMRLGGASYSDFSFSQGGTVVTLTDAPTVSTGAPHIDFFVYGITPTPVGSTVTFSDVREETYLKLGHETTSEQFPTSLVDGLLNEASRVLNNSRTNPKLKLRSYSFNPTGMIVTADYDATRINVNKVPSTTPASGWVMVNAASPVKYGSVGSEYFGSLSGYDFVLQSNLPVNVGYAIPSGAKKIANVYVDGIEMNYIDVRLFTNGGHTYKDLYARYTVFTDPTDGTQYLFVPNSADSRAVVTVHYVPVNGQYTADDDIVDFEPEYRQLLCLYAAYKALVFREDDRWQSYKQEYLEEFKKYKAYLRRTEGTSVSVVHTSLRNH